MSETKRLGPVTAYAIAVEHGFVGTEQEWLASLRPTDAEVQESVDTYFEENPTARVADGSVTAQKLASDVKNTLTGLDNDITALRAAVGTPLKASAKTDMTDTGKIYVYTGSETGMTAGDWYYYDGSAWVSGGVYNSAAVETDTTLSVSGMAADAETTGKELNNIKDALSLTESLGVYSFPLNTVKNVSGITYAFDGISCTVTGITTIENNFINITERTSVFKGKKSLFLKFSGENVGVRIFYKINNEDSYTSLISTSYRDRIVNIPDEATIFLIRLETKANVQINETVTLILFDIDGLLVPSDLSCKVHALLSRDNDCNEIFENGLWGVSYNAASTPPAALNWPYDSYGLLITAALEPKNGSPSTWIQMAIAHPRTRTSCTYQAHIRAYVGKEWGDWRPLQEEKISDSFARSFAESAGISCRYEDGKYICNGTSTEGTFFTLLDTSIPGRLIKHDVQYTLRVISSNPDNLRVRVYYYLDEDGTTVSHAARVCSTGDIYYSSNVTRTIIRLDILPGAFFVNDWIKVDMIESVDTDATVLTYTGKYTSCDDVRTSGRIFNSFSKESGNTLSNYAYQAAGWLDTIETHGFIFQLAYPYNSVRSPAWRVFGSGSVWSDWLPLGSGEVINNTYIKEVTQNNFTNAYTINTTPTITTDTHGWLKAVDTNTEGETGKTDMTGAILSMLEGTGYCHLGEGIFYVSGSIDMPEGSTLIGCGKNTIIKLLDSVENGYCVRVGRHCTVRDIEFRGRYSSSNADVASEDIGGRDGIRFIANKDGQESSQPAVLPCMITNCWFSGFNGSGIYCHNTGGSTRESLFVTDCYIEYCTVGLNIDYYSEYSKFTTVITYRCYYACINNGGNNVFTSCTFHGTIGFMIDNSNGDKRNNAHGSVIGCTFNHIDNWNRTETLGMGDAVVIKNVRNGYIFTGCQIWYGEIRIENSCGIAFSDCLIGGKTPEIEATGDYPVFFNGCIFHQKPTINVTSGTRFDNCYLDETGEAITS